MRNYLIKLISVITIFSMIVAVAVGYIAINRSNAYLEAEIEQKILNTSEKYANDFSAQFNHMEGLTDSLAAYVTTSFDLTEYTASKEAYLDSYEQELAEIIQCDLETSENAHSLYVTFNPELSDFGREVWFVMKDGKLEQIEADFQEDKRDFSLPYKNDMAYFFEPKETDGGIWTLPYFDKDISEEVFSYSRAIYVEDEFIGVAGADITAKDIVNTVKDMKLYSGGYSTLLDTEYNMIVEPVEMAEDEIQLISSSLMKKESEDSGIVEYTCDGIDEILGYSKMDNGWVMAVIQPREEAYSSITKLTMVFVTLASVLAVVLILFLIAFTQPFIKKQTALEKENREKDLMLMYQSRHAKIGEMFANITHQWKQPLNTINLIMANLLDSYRYDDLDEARLEKSVKKVGNIVTKMSETITDFSGFLKPTKEKVFFDVRDCIKSAISLMEESINYHGITINIENEQHRDVYGYANEMTHVIFNILNNARDAIISAALEERRIDVRIVQNEELVEVHIQNRGEQISEEVLEHIFDPYFTTKEASGGTGLGLFISRQIVEDRMHGKLFMENVQDGVRCRIAIPNGNNTEVGHENS